MIFFLLLHQSCYSKSSAIKTTLISILFFSTTIFIHFPSNAQRWGFFKTSMRAFFKRFRWICKLQKIFSFLEWKNGCCSLFSFKWMEKMGRKIVCILKCKMKLKQQKTVVKMMKISRKEWMGRRKWMWTSSSTCPFISFNAYLPFFFQVCFAIAKVMNKIYELWIMKSRFLIFHVITKEIRKVNSIESEWKTILWYFKLKSNT